MLLKEAKTILAKQSVEYSRDSAFSFCLGIHPGHGIPVNGMGVFRNVHLPCIAVHGVKVFFWINGHFADLLDSLDVFHSMLHQYLGGFRDNGFLIDGAILI